MRTAGRCTAALSQSYPSMGPCLAWYLDVQPARQADMEQQVPGQLLCKLSQYVYLFQMLQPEGWKAKCIECKYPKDDPWPSNAHHQGVFLLPL